jgi:hypothetical protein
MLAAELLTVLPRKVRTGGIATGGTLLTLVSSNAVLRASGICPTVSITNAIADSACAAELASDFSKFSVCAHTFENMELCSSRNSFCVVVLSKHFIKELTQNKQAGCGKETEALLQHCLSDTTHSFRKRLLFAHIEGFERKQVQDSQLLSDLVQDAFIFDLSKHDHRAALLAEIFGCVEDIVDDDARAEEAPLCVGMGP